jgi:hypothetical protein
VTVSRARRFLVALAVVAATVLPVAAAPGTACANATYHAGLVVDTGRVDHTFCVVLDAPEVTGTHLIELAGTQFGLDYRLGFGGRAVCRLDGIGVDGEDCFGDYPDFWGYWHGAGRTWTWSTGSAADHRVGNGDLEGWSWGTGDSGATHAAPPPVSIGDVCRVAPSPSPSPSPAPSPPPSPAPGGSAGTGGEGESAGATGSGADDPGDPAAPQSPSRATTGHHSTAGSDHTGSEPSSEPTRDADPSPSSGTEEVSVRAAGSEASADGPPTAGLVAIGAMAVLTAAGWARLRRSRRTDRP